MLSIINITLSKHELNPRFVEMNFGYKVVLGIISNLPLFDV